MNLIDSIKKHEGFRNRVYNDSEGNLTIGYGFAIKDLRLDEDIASIILERKLANTTVRCYESFWWFREMPQTVQDVIVEMIYQIGLNGFMQFVKTIELLKKKEWEKAGKEMLDSKWAKQTPRRARDLAETLTMFGIRTKG